MTVAPAFSAPALPFKITFSGLLSPVVSIEVALVTVGVSVRSVGLPSTLSVDSGDLLPAKSSACVVKVLPFGNWSDGMVAVVAGVVLPF
ncbi:hypothetical protein HS327_01263 [Glaesserella parasuis]|nr:hypothetical protein HS327_01263 [Glaesserella parasuis]